MAPRSRPSLTARIISLIRAGLERPAVVSGDPEGDDRLAESLRIPVPLQMPGMPAYVEARTGFYDRALLRACESGTIQVVIVAAGYDGRALRFRQPGVRFFELDHPDTQADKRGRLADLGVSAADVRFVAVDLGRDSVTDALTAAGHDAATATHFMCEGLTPYLPMPVLAGLLRALAEAAGPGSTLAVDFMERGAGLFDRTRVGLVRLGVAVLGERMVTLLDDSQAAAILRENGWTDVDLIGPGHGLPGTFAVARPPDRRAPG